MIALPTSSVSGSLEIYGHLMRPRLLAAATFVITSTAALAQTRPLYKTAAQPIDAAFPKLAEYSRWLALLDTVNKVEPGKELRVTHYPRTAGSPTGGNPKVILRAFRDLLWLRLHLSD